MSFGINQAGATGLTKDLLAASTTILGGVKQGGSVAIAGDGTLTVPYVGRLATRAIVQPPAAYVMDRSAYFVQVSLGNGGNSNITLPTAPAQGDLYEVSVFLTGATATAVVSCTGSQSIYVQNTPYTSLKLYVGQRVQFYCYDGVTWIAGFLSASSWTLWTPTFSGDAGVTVTVANIYTNLWRVDENTVEVQFFFSGVQFTGGVSGKCVFTLPIAVPASGYAGVGVMIPPGVVAIDNLSAAGAQNEQGHIQGNAGAASATVYPGSPAGNTYFQTTRTYTMKGALRYGFR